MGKVKFPSGSSGCELAFRLTEDVTWVKFLARGKDWGVLVYTMATRQRLILHDAAWILTFLILISFFL